MRVIDKLAEESSAHLRHEFRTPVNHIIGYSELLMEDAAHRHLESLVPVLESIRDGGRRLLESIQAAFGDHVRGGDLSAVQTFKTSLQATASDISANLTSLIKDLQTAHDQTLADLDVISWALRRLLELAGQDAAVAGPRGPAKGSQPSRAIEDSTLFTPIHTKRSGGKILIADDDFANRNLLRRRLECEGHQVMEASNGLEVIDLLKNSPCDLVLLDIMMPVLDGFQTLARMKSDPRLRELPVIMISALDQLRGVVGCIEMGAEDYLPKPFNRVLLRARIGASLEKKWLRDRERCKTEELEQTLRLLEEAQEKLSLLASRDSLTELANRRAVEAHLDNLVKKGNPFTAIYIDLNGFKQINDNYGHTAGDDLLRQVGRRLKSIFRSTDFIGRWGGDEFVALVQMDLVGAETYIARIAESMASEFVIAAGEGARSVRIGAAVGVAAWRPGDTTTEVLHRADFAMYEEKLRHAA